MEPSGALSPSSASSANGNMGRCQRGTPNIVGFFLGVPWIGTGRVPSKQINRLREHSRTNHAAQCNKKEETRGIQNLGNTLVVKHNDTKARQPLTLQLKCANTLWGRTKQSLWAFKGILYGHVLGKLTEYLHVGSQKREMCLPCLDGFAGKPG